MALLSIVQEYVDSWLTGCCAGRLQGSARGEGPLAARCYSVPRALCTGSCRSREVCASATTSTAAMWGVSPAP
eukprot:scaffold2019_cov316-Prasinococcus_capsulatus_cf.AAC.2